MELKQVAKGLTTHSLDIEQLIDCVPDIILADVTHPDKEHFIPWAEEILHKTLGKAITIKHLPIDSLRALYATMEEIGGLIGKPALAARLVDDIKSHITKWVDTYKTLCQGKTVIVLSETNPFIVEAGWVDDLLHLFGATTLERPDINNCREVPWIELAARRPDVIFVAPHNAFLNQSVRRLSALETSEGWEDLPAVKRGAVFFAPGTNIYRPGPRFLKGIAALISAMVGLEHPILTDQDDVFRIRQVEMYRHKMLDPS
jgi:ABC-type Fe3+-hydroxamate transport system substrate-binding protein